MANHALQTMRMALILALVACPAIANQDFVEVRATGEGITKDEARRDALRNALEKGGEVEIASRSKVENFALIRDTIFARADGIVTDYTIIEEGRGAGGTFYCKIRAKVKKGAIGLEWGEIQNVLDQLGRPRIAVMILERIDDVIQDSSILESRIEERLSEAGFSVYASNQLRVLAEKESGDAAAELNEAKVRAIAKDNGAQIFISGTAQANWAGVKDLYGEPTAMYNGDAMVKTYWTATGALIASKSIPNWRGGARSYREQSPQAGKMALSNAGREIVEATYRTVMKHWATRLSAGGEITLEVEGVNFAQAAKIKKKLATMPKVTRVYGPSFTKGIATYRIVAKMMGEDMAMYLIEDDWAQLLEVVDAKSDRVQAKGVGK